jgi:hypothetical protein
MGIAEEWMELAQHSPILCRDGRTTGAQTWVTDFLTRRVVIDEAEVQIIHERLGLKQGYPPLSALPVISWTILQRVPEVT